MHAFLPTGAVKTIFFFFFAFNVVKTQTSCLQSYTVVFMLMTRDIINALLRAIENSIFHKPSLKLMDNF